MMLAVSGIAYANPATPSGIRMVSAASGPYAAEPRASRPKTGTPLATPIFSDPSSDDAIGFPRKSR